MLEPGSVLDKKYQNGAPIGQGGFGYVYRACARLRGETVTIKERNRRFARWDQLLHSRQAHVP